jgi:hypothetical protein
MHLQLLKACVKMFKKNNLAICRVKEEQDMLHSAEHSAKDSAALIKLLYNAQTKEQIDIVVAAANRWLANHPHDEAVRLARKQAKRRRLGSPL